MQVKSPNISEGAMADKKETIISLLTAVNYKNYHV